jgi:hypothetical protein
MKRARLMLAILVILASGIIMWQCPYLIPMWMRHVFYLNFVPNEKLYRPVAFFQLPLHETDAKAECVVDFPYYDIYEIGICSEKKVISGNFQFNGIIRADFYCDDKLIAQEILSSIKGGWAWGSDLKFLKKASIGEFDVPIKKKYYKKIKIVLTVIKPEFQLKKNGDQIKLYIAVCAAF